jgi:tRNA A37 threonylcarbamoyladenosine biosynthesis protein TsaE
MQKVIFIEWPENLQTDRDVDVIINLDHDHMARHASIKCKDIEIESSIKAYYENN